MRRQIHIDPETEEEVEFLERLADAREFAIEETDLEEADIASTFSLFASGIYQEGGPSNSTTDPDLECPQCGQPIKDVENPGLGMDPVLVPCGCQVEHEDLPQELYLEND